MTQVPEKTLQSILDETFTAFDRVLEDYQAVITTQELGWVKQVSQSTALVEGLPTVKAQELVRFITDQRSHLEGMAFNLDSDDLGVILLGSSKTLEAGQRVHRTGRVLDVPVGAGLQGRVIDALGCPLDGKGPLYAEERRPIERQAPAILDRAPVSVPLQTGIKVIDALFPIGRGQRELILGDRQTGKTALAVDTIINQKDKDVICIYCAIGQRDAAVARVIADLERFDAIDYSVVVVASGEDAPGLQFVAPYAATSMAEYFRDQGQDALIVYDDLTRHARAYRELSLLLRRPPGREAYPGDIFFIHSRLLERSTQLNQDLGGGSLTALPIIETQAQNISAYIPTNLISICDGQLFLSPDLFQKGILPAVDVGRSVSRVGGKAQLAAYQEVAGDLRLSYSQFQELEVFSRFGAQLEEETRHQLERGRRVREVLKQPQNQPIPVPQQIAIMLAVTEGLFDELSLDQIEPAESAIQRRIQDELPGVSERILEDKKLTAEDQEALRDTLSEIIKTTLDTGPSAERSKVLNAEQSKVPSAERSEV